MLGKSYFQDTLIATQARENVTIIHCFVYKVAKKIYDPLDQYPICTFDNINMLN